MSLTYKEACARWLDLEATQNEIKAKHTSLIKDLEPSPLNVAVLAFGLAVADRNMRAARSRLISEFPFRTVFGNPPWKRGGGL